MKKIDKYNLLEEKDNIASLKISFKEQHYKCEYGQYIIKIKISDDNNYIKIICLPKIYVSEIYEYTININEFKKIFSEKIKTQNSPEEFGKLIKKLLIANKVLINYDKNLYRLSFQIMINNNINLIFNKKINISKHKFKNNPNLKFKETIIETNCGGGCNSTFDVFLCYKDSKQYLASSNYKNYNIDIIYLDNNQLTTSLKGHKNEIYSIRYFINDNNKNEYLISSDSNKVVIVWNILNNYHIDFLVIENYSYYRNIYSCMITNIDIFNYVIISSYTSHKNYLDKGSENDYTKMYSLMNGDFIKNIYNTKNNCTRYLLSWHNEDNCNDYIIECCDGKISINNLLKKELYCQFESEIEGEEFLSGFIFTKNNNDYLCTGSWNGFVRIWNLVEKKEINYVRTLYSELYYIILWSQKYAIIANKFIKVINVIDIETLEIVTNIKNENFSGIKSIKKVIHPQYGESLLTCSENGTINLFVLYNKF